MIRNVRNLLVTVLRLLRHTPLHPQWLLGNAHDTAQWVRKSAFGRVLDIGCADRWIQPLLQPDCQYVGLDYPATGGDLYGARPDVFGDASHLPFPDACFDTVVMLEVLEHLREPQNALREIARVVRPQGCVLLSMPFLYPIHDAPHDYQRYTANGLEREMEIAGLRINHFQPTLGSAESAGLIACLALGGMALESIRHRHPSMILLPLIAGLVPAVNLFAWLGGRLLPSWSALVAGYRIGASRS